MNLFVIPLGYPNEYNPTLNIFTYEQVKALRGIGCKVTVLYVQMLPTRMLFSKAEKGIKYVNDGVTARYTIKMKTFKESKFSWLNSIIYRRKLKKLYKYVIGREQKPDAVYAHFTCFAGWAACRLNIDPDIALIVQEHDVDILKSKMNRYRQKCLKETVEKADKFICVSETLKAFVLLYTGTKKQIDVIPNMVDPMFRYYPANQNGDEFVFLSVGNLYRVKCFDVLIKAFCTAFSADENVKLRICGGGEMESRLRELITDFGREHQILLLGRKNRDDILKEYIGCQSFVLASSHETFGIVYREALAVGRPVITTNHGGFGKGEWSDDYGRMVEINDIEGLSNALKFVKNNYNSFNNELISEKSLKTYKSENVAKRIYDTLKEAVNSKKAR